ncbi:MAG TPA: SPOR domain-containing protein [Polyangiales bacterium]|nr:SPOR domain-containing protein [Polyangiales bacterium]
MSTRVRDLEQLQEDDDSERRRKRGALLLAAFATLLLAFAIGIMVGKAVLPAEPKRDPFDQLDKVLEASRAQQPAAAPAAQPPAAKPPVSATDLGFERALTSGEERPEVLAALAEAAREEESLAAARTPPAARGAMPVPEPDDDDDVEAKKPTMVVKFSKPAPQAHGDGEFSLQVASYDSKAAADAFASALRARGHTTFITTAEVEGRGRYYRVRLGPFSTRQQAEEYRRDFEARERMNTIIVKRDG